MAREQRTLVEEELKAGLLPCVVATSSLELGIDMGAVDLVVQVEAPPSVASGLQRVGARGTRSARCPGGRLPQVPGRPRLLRRGRRADDRGRDRVAALSAQPAGRAGPARGGDGRARPVDRRRPGRVVRRAAPFAALPDSALHSVLDMLAGRYPSEEFGELRARITWDRVTDELRGRPGRAAAGGHLRRHDSRTAACSPS